jgi:hypothetical protein
MIFIDISSLEDKEVRRLFDLLRGKMIVVKNLVKASSISDFLEKISKSSPKK